MKLEDINIGDVVYDVNMKLYCKVTKILGHQVWGFWYYEEKSPRTYEQYTSCPEDLILTNKNNRAVSFFMEA